MRTLYLTFALWYDPHWRTNFRRSWKNRRYWLAKPCTPHVRGRALTLQLGAYSIRITFVGAEKTSSRAAGEPQSTPRRSPHG